MSVGTLGTGTDGIGDRQQADLVVKPPKGQGLGMGMGGMPMDIAMAGMHMLHPSGFMSGDY